MKKLFMICFILLLFCPYALSDVVQNEVFTSGDYEYVLLDDGTAKVTKCKTTNLEESLMDGILRMI